jgi:hypothetical protein
MKSALLLRGWTGVKASAHAVQAPRICIWSRAWANYKQTAEPAYVAPKSNAQIRQPGEDDDKQGDIRW